MEFTKAQTVEECLLLTLIQKVEDNTAAVDQLLQRESDSIWMGSEGNVLKGWPPCKGFDPEEEAEWIQEELVGQWRYCDTWPGRDKETEIRVCIYYEENAKHLQDSGFLLKNEFYQRIRALENPWQPGRYHVCWAPTSDHA